MQFPQDGTSIDSLRANGWYRVLRAPDNPLPSPQDNADVLVYVKQLWGSVIYQKIISLWGARQTLERTLISDSWDILKDDLYATKDDLALIEPIDRAAISDLIVEADKGVKAQRIAMCGINTLGTPYKAGLTTANSGVAYINMTSADYGTILFIVSGSTRIFLKSKVSNKWNDWVELGAS